MELSHRSKHFGEILARTKSNLRKLMDIPDNYEILFMQGGATTQFSAIFYNLVAAKQAATGAEDLTVDYFITGSWSKKAAEEAERLAKDTHVKVNRVVDAKKLTGKYDRIPPRDTWQLSDPERTAYAYYCDNETVHGVEFPFVPEVDPRVPLVTDISSNFLSRPIDVKKFGVIYGGAQKNLGPAGVTIVIIRKDLVVDLSKGPLRPLMLDYHIMLENDSMYNTPPTFSIYMVSLTLDWLLEQGGLIEVEKTNNRKSSKLYEVIDRLSLFTCPVQPDSRSEMNVVFTMTSPELEKEFLKGAEERNMVQLKGHRSVGTYNFLSLSKAHELTIKICRWYSSVDLQCYARGTYW